MNSNKKIYHVKLSEPKEGKTDFYFGSLSAIFERFTPSEIGCGVNRLWNIGVAKGIKYENKKCTITSGTIIRKPGERGRK